MQCFSQRPLPSENAARVGGAPEWPLSLLAQLIFDFEAFEEENPTALLKQKCNPVNCQSNGKIIFKLNLCVIKSTVEQLQGLLSTLGVLDYD